MGEIGVDLFLEYLIYIARETWCDYSSSGLITSASRLSFEAIVQ